MSLSSFIRNAVSATLNESECIALSATSNEIDEQATIAKTTKRESFDRKRNFMVFIAFAENY